MSEATAEVPVLGVGREQTQAWTQAAMMLAGLLRQRRMELGRLAWGDAEDAARRYDRLEQAAEPLVRVMGDQERRVFDEQRQADSSTLQSRHVEGPEGSVSVTVGVLPYDGGWGLVADGRSVDGTQIHETQVRCANETIAKQLADELLHSAPAKVARLHGFAALAAERATAAAGEVRESEAQRLARTASTVREVWPAALAERIILPTTAQRARGEQWNPAFGTLAWRLHEMEERGYSMADVLRRLDMTRLRATDVGNPAALAEYLVEEMAPHVRVINLDSERWAQPGPDAAVRPAGPRPAGRTAASVAQAEQAAGAALTLALSPSLLERVQGSRSYDWLRNGLVEQHQKGQVLSTLLEALPVDRIAAANDPAGYLAAIVRRRVGGEPLPRSSVDRVEMGDLVARGLPTKVADQVVGCQAWPGLTKRLAAWQQEGLPVEDMLDTLPAARIATARRPAAYVIVLMNAEAARRRSGQNDDTPEAAAHRSVNGAQDRAGARKSRAGRGQADPPSDSEPDLAWTEDLDPASSVDRVGLEAALGLGPPTVDARLEARLQSNADAEEASHTAAARTAEARAAGHERDAADERSTPEALDAAAAREDLDGQEQARVDDQLAAGERAIAAEERGAASAAAARAEVTFTAGQNAARQSTTPRAAAPARPVKTRHNNPSRERGRSR